MSEQPRKRIVVFSGPTATVQNTVPLVTSNKAREKYGLPLLKNADGTPLRFDALRPQRLAAPVTVYVRQFSAHPLESDADDLYAAPDGYVGADGIFHVARTNQADVPVYEVTLKPEDGVYLLPYMARQANGQPWDDDTAHPGAPEHLARQPFYADASRLFEEIDRFGLGEASGHNNLLAARADYEFVRVVPSGGYRKGLPAAQRTDLGDGDIALERMGHDFYNYRPFHLYRDPPRAMMARVVNRVQAAMDSGRYAGGIWLEGSPNIEESLMWMNLLIDTTLPICGNSSQRPHGSLANDGDHNIVDAVNWILSDAWKDQRGDNAAGVVAVLDQLVYAARDVQKADARPGGYTATGGHGGIIGSMGHSPGAPVMTYAPNRRHTHQSAVNLHKLPQRVNGVRRVNGVLTQVPVQIKDDGGWLLPTALPEVRFAKTARYLPASADVSSDGEVEIHARIAQNLVQAPLAGFVAEGQAGNAKVARPIDAALMQATCSGMPVVRVGRGNAEGIIPRSRDGLNIGGSNLTATKARILLMACLLKLGALPPAADCKQPTLREIAAIREKIAEYQTIFDTH